MGIELGLEHGGVVVSVSERGSLWVWVLVVGFMRHFGDLC